MDRRQPLPNRVTRWLRMNPPDYGRMTSNSDATGDATAVRIGSKSVSSRSDSFRFESGRVLVV